MKRLGEVLHVSHSTKRLIVRGRESLRVGGFGIDSTGYIVGKVEEIFGPINGPYYALKPLPKTEPLKYIGQTLFYLPRENSSNAKRQYGHRHRR